MPVVCSEIDVSGARPKCLCDVGEGLFQVIKRGTLRRAQRLIWLGFVMATLASLCLASDASAHARLVSSNPESGSALGPAPESIQLLFSEGIAEQFLRVDVLASDGTPVPTSATTIDPSDSRTVTITLADPLALPSGSYSVIYSVFSSVDSHTSSGAISFSVGTGQPPAQVAGSQDSLPPWWQVLGRWMEVVGWVLVTGGGLFGLLHVAFLSESAGHLQQISARWLRLLQIALSVAAIGLVFSLWNQAVAVTSSSWSTLPSLSTLQQILFETNYGIAWMLRLFMVGIGVLLLNLIGAGYFRPASRVVWAALGLIGSAALVSFPWAGHPAADDRLFYATGFSALHMIVTSLWIGGLPFLIIAVRQLTISNAVDDLETASALTRRFSISSIASVFLLTVSGLVNAELNVSGPEALRTQRYGQVLLVKQFLVLPAIVSGAINLLVIRPRIQALRVANETEAARSSFRILRTVVTVEFVLGAAIIALAAVLTQSAPATAPIPVDVASRQVTVDQRQPATDVEVWLLARLSGNSSDRFLLTLTDADGSAPEAMQRVIIGAELISSSSGTTGGNERFDATQVVGTTNAWEFPAARLGIEGNWQTDIVVRRAGIEDVSTAFVFDTIGTAANPPRLVEDDWRIHSMSRDAWLFLAMAGVVLVFAMAGLYSLRGQDPVPGIVLLILTLLVVGGFVVTSLRRTVPVTPNHELSNPVANSAIVLMQGEDLFLNSCVLCHGAAGKGSELADPQHNHGEAANLTSDRVRLQSDGDLYYWISNGKVGTEMPAHDQALTEEERWAIVYYLRLLQGETGD